MTRDNAQQDSALPKLGRYWWIPLGFLSLALLLLLGTPIIVSYRVRQLRHALTDGTDRALVLVNAFQAALATEFLAREEADQAPTMSSDSALRVTMADEQRDERALDSLVRRMDAESMARFAELRAIDQQRRLGEPLGSGDSARVNSHNTSRSLRFRTLSAAQRLQQHLERASTQTRERIHALEHLDVITAGSLVPIAFASVVVVIWIGRRVLLFAHAIDVQHRALIHATETKAALIRGVTHDVKNPLGAALGYADLMEEAGGPLSAQQHQMIQRIQRLLRTASETITELLDLARAEAGQLRVSRASADLYSIARDTVADYEAAATEKRHRLEIEPGAEVLLETDAMRVRQILGNLIGNAIKYTPAGGRILVRVIPKSSRAENGLSRFFAAIEVHDSGPGVPHQFRDRLFEEFFRLPATQHTVPGTGVGLAISKWLAELLGGHLTIGDGDLGGALFTLWLPIEDSQHPSDGEGGRLERATGSSAMARDSSPSLSG